MNDAVTSVVGEYALLVRLPSQFKPVDYVLNVSISVSIIYAIPSLLLSVAIIDLSFATFFGQ